MPAHVHSRVNCVYAVYSRYMMDENASIYLSIHQRTLFPDVKTHQKTCVLELASPSVSMYNCLMSGLVEMPR